MKVGKKRRDVLVMLGMGMFAAAGAKAGAMVPDDVRGAAKAKLQREQFGDLRIYFDGPTGQLKALQAGSLELKPGMSPHPPHQHPEEEIMLITAGEGEIVLDGKTTRVAPGSMMYCAAGHTHGVTNTGQTPMMFYFYKWIAK
ncbi:MAG TPA: cupin domain-containing protein [Bryobacterales bacterium]|nr:cupin domain-containing protein [Bryobacterales bacterium]